MTLKTTTDLGGRNGKVKEVTLTPSQANTLVRFPGTKALGVLRVAADVASPETVTIGADVYEVEIVNTDSTDNTAGGDFNNTTNPLVLANAGADYPNVGWGAGKLIRIESEIMRVESINGNRVRLKRGDSGTTIATHANALDIFKGDGVTAGRIAVGLVTTLTPAAFMDALVDVINTEGTELVTAVEISDNEMLLEADSVGVKTTALAETLAGANNAWDTAAMRGGAAAALKRVATVTRVPNATEVALGKLHIPLDFAPTVVHVLVVVTATGVPTAWNGGVVITGGNNPRVTLDNTGLTDWAATDTIHVLAIE